MRANRLKVIIHNIISDSQSAFVPNKLITDNIMITYEMNHFLKRKTKGKVGYAALKADMSKAYDRFEWNFIEQIICVIQFPDNWINRIMMCFVSVRYNITHVGHETVFYTIKGFEAGLSSLVLFVSHLC